MKIVYMGTPDFAVPALEALVKDGQEIGYVVSQPDAVRDRGKKLKPTAVKAKAKEYGIEVLQPDRIKENLEFEKLIREYKPDLIVVAAYGKIVPKSILNIPIYGCINIHGSILPRWRGAAPIQWSIIEGDEVTGVTLMYMEEGLDTGDMIAKEYTEIGKKTSGQLHEEIALMGARLLISKLRDFEEGNVIAHKQDENLAKYAPMLTKKDGIIDFNKSAKEIECCVRGLNPWPGAYTYINNDMFKIWVADILERDSVEKPGTIVGIADLGIEVATTKGILVLKEVQVPGKKRMSVKDFLRGNNIEIGMIFAKAN